MNFAPIEKVFTFLPKNLIEEENDNIQLISWALQALRMLEIVQRYERKICVLEIKNHKVKLPLGFYKLNSVTHQLDHCEEDLNKLIYETKEKFDCECENTTEGICKLPISYSLFLSSEYYKNNYQPLKYQGIVTDFLSNCFTNYPCQNTFSITTDGYIYTNLKEGFLCIDYQTEITNGEGFLVPDDIDLFRYLAKYIKYFHFENRSINHEETTYNKFINYLQRAEILSTKVKGKFLLKGINLQMIQDIQFMKLRSIYLPLAFGNRDEGI